MIRMRKISKAYYLRQIMVCWLACYMFFCFGIPAQIAMADPAPGALPDGFVLVAGAGSPGTIGNTMLIQNISNGAIFRWDGGFNIGELATVNFDFITSGSSVLNRDVTGNMSEIYGTLTANGNVYIVNPAGIIFGGGATINVAQLVASSLKITDEAFTSGLTTGSFQFTDGVGADNVINEGTITAERIALIAKNVINRGALVATDCVVMAAGETVLISENSPVAVEVSMGAGWASGDDLYQVRNEGGDGISVDGDTAQVILAAGDIWSAALVKAYSDGGYEADAVATIDIDAAGNVIITDEVVAEAVGDRETNDAIATITVDAGGDVDVIATEGDTASIKAVALDGITNTAEVLICAEGDVTVEAEGGWEDVIDDIWYGSTASIEAIAGPVKSTTLNNTAMVQNNTTMAQNNTADVKIGAGEGINVTAISDFYTVDSYFSTEASASIAAYAYGGAENTAGILACANSDVQVTAERGGEAMIKSEAGADEASSDATTTVISHKGDVVVDSSLGGNASIESQVYGGTADTATTQVYATDVVVTGEGSSIRAIGPGGIVVQRGDGFTFCATSDGRIAETDGSATLIIDGSDSKDCPDCPPCPCDDEELFAPVAPLAKFEIPRIEGCPELMQAVAMELGITAETIQVAIGNALALNPSIQPCEACATLVDAVSILRDEDGSRMAAMVQVFNALAPADAPFTPEMATSIAMAFGGAAEGSQYASAMEYIDAFVQYATVLDIELGSPTGDSVAFVMEKYGAGITGSDNGNIAAFVATRLGAIGE